MPLMIQEIVIQYEILGGDLQSTLFLDTNFFSLFQPSTYTISQLYPLDDLENAEIFYDSMILKKLKSYDIYDVYYLSIEFILLVMIGYLVFIFPEQRKRRKNKDAEL
jgi:hypothetical protein